uniref:Uncharacterized protein n=1 Tax=Rhizophora mucronata TaxID=61149 RepID=A0A2P2JY57_RHIMU
MNRTLLSSELKI